MLSYLIHTTEQFLQTNAMMCMTLFTYRTEEMVYQMIITKQESKFQNYKSKSDFNSGNSNVIYFQDYLKKEKGNKLRDKEKIIQEIIARAKNLDW